MRTQFVIWGIAAIVAAIGTNELAGADGQVIVGAARVIDGDTLRIEDERLRLENIDAPEKSQECRRNGDAWFPGPLAAAFLREMIGDRPARCTWRKRDQYGRPVAKCAVEGTDLNRAMVRAGWAWSWMAGPVVMGGYFSEQEKARAEGLGVWAPGVSCEEPWRWRKARR